MDIYEKIELLGGMQLLPSPNARRPTLSELTEFATSAGVALPNTYKNFVLRFGCCGFKKWIVFPLIGAKGHSVPVERHLTLFAGGGESDLGLVWFWRTYRDRMPRTMVPIAEAGGGDLVCIGVSEQNGGQTYFWDHHNEWDEEGYLDGGKPVPDNLEYQNVTLVANSFEEFILSMRATEP